MAADPKSTPLLSLEALVARGRMLHGDVLTAFRLSTNTTNPHLLDALNYLVLANQALEAAAAKDATTMSKEPSGG